MIISVAEAKQLVNLDGWTDKKIEMKLKAIEQTIRAYTNNNFQNRGCRITADISGGILYTEALCPFESGETVQISESQYNNGLFTVAGVAYDGCSMSVNENVADEKNVLVTKVEYPADVIDCCVNLLEWEVNYRGKVGIQSETLSRHSTTYFNMDNANSVMGYPVSLLGCLKAYKKVRF